MPEADLDSHRQDRTSHSVDGVRNPVKTIVFREPVFTGMSVANIYPEFN